MPRKPAVQKYGIGWTSGNPVSIELECIRRGGRWEQNGKVCGEGLDYHIKAFQKLVWPGKLWHKWNEDLIVPEMAKGGTIAIFGPASCVHGETRIETSEGPKPVQKITEAPVVMTLQGPVQASIPFWKGRKELFEVTLESGRKFKATAEHRVMLPDGSFVSVGSLYPGQLLRGEQSTRVESIKSAGADDFYDLQVPGPNHYFAEGAIHHNSGKTREAADFVLTMYWAFPETLTALCSSTTRELLNMRVWGEIKKEFRKAKERYPWLPGYLIDSTLQITTDGREVEGREFRNGIKGLPCKKGNEWQGLGDYSGLKNERMILVADECHLMPDGFLKGAANLKANPNFTAIYLGNLSDLNTPLGEAAEPEHGWDSIPDSDRSWVYKTRFMHGRAVQLIGADSPNLDYAEGAEPFPSLIGRRYLREAEHDYGKDTPLYNMMAAGKIPRGTLENRVITKQVCRQFNVMEPPIWGGEELTRLYCADLSYTFSHGDRTVGFPMAFGRDFEGKLRLAVTERPKTYAPSDRQAGSLEDQLATMIRMECERLGIEPSHFFFDGTGRSSFTAACMRLWDTAVNPIEFGGRATDRANFLGRVHHHGPNKGELIECSEIFGKFVTELWFASRYVIEADQLRGLTEDFIKEGCSRIWELTKGNKMDVENKQDMKTRLGRSPDIWDALVSGIEGARRLGFPLGQLASPDREVKKSMWFRELSQQMKKARQKQELAYS